MKASLRSPTASFGVEPGRVDLVGGRGFERVEGAVLNRVTALGRGGGRHERAPPGERSAIVEQVDGYHLGKANWWTLPT